MFRKKVLLKWKEPRFAYKHNLKQMSWKQWLFQFGIYVAVYALIGLLIGFFIDFYNSVPFSELKFLIPAGLVACLGAFFWVLARLIDTNPPEISLLEKGISIYTPPDHYDGILYEMIENCSFVKSKIAEQEYNVLKIKARNGNEVSYEIALETKIEDITEILKSKNIQIKPSLFS